MSRNKGKFYKAGDIA